ncbi:hypothetical protein ABL57_10200 [Kocuria sp. SM24M-10]|nr:hypothetical protein ABL57_10200 [Kocuria sp. SM24M-10]
MRSGSSCGAVKATSRVIVTLSETSTPPASMAAFQVMPKSLREMVVSAEKPARVTPKASTTTPLNSVASSTVRVTSLMVSSPVMVPSSPSKATAVERKVIVGCCSTSKKSALRTWPSRSAFFVSMEAICTVAVSVESSTGSATRSWASTSPKVPRTFEMPAWRTVKATSEWAGSKVQEPGTRAVSWDMVFSSGCGSSRWLLRQLLYEPHDDVSTT